MFIKQKTQHIFFVPLLVWNWSAFKSNLMENSAHNFQCSLHQIMEYFRFWFEHHFAYGYWSFGTMKNFLKQNREKKNMRFDWFHFFFHFYASVATGSFTNKFQCVFFYHFADAAAVAFHSINLIYIFNIVLAGRQSNSFHKKYDGRTIITQSIWIW